MPKHILIEMQQHIGSPCRPLVRIGERVKKGQPIASYDTVNIHSSVYGEIVEIRKEAVKIIPDTYQPEEYVKIKETNSYLEAVKEAGVVGAGGAGFPTHIKLNTNLENGCIIMNAAECEPLFGHNIHMVEEQADMLIRGIKYCMEITKAKKGYIAIKPKHKKALIAIAKACKNESIIEIKYLPDRYPVGDEKVIIRELLGVTLKPGQLPGEVNALVANVETIKRITEAIELRKPVISKDFTIGGRLKNTKGGYSKVYLDQPIGMPIKKYIDDCGGYLEPYGEILLGGPFTGAVGNEESVVSKTLGGIFVAMPFPAARKNFGILACECGAEDTRLKEIVKEMGGTVVAEAKCKRMVEVSGRYRCEEPGNCPGQAEAILKLRAEGAEALMIGACED